MDFILEGWRAQFNAVGPLWFCALAAAFVSMCMDSAHPPREQGEPKEEGAGARGILMLASLLTPFLLIAHACWVTTQNGLLDVQTAVVSAVSIVGAAVVVSTLVGAAIGALAPGLGRTLYKLAPWVALPVLAFTLYVAGESSWSVINNYILRRGGGA